MIESEQHGYVELRLAHDDDGLIQITVAAMSAAGYSGIGKGYVDEAQVRRFADCLGDYPLKDSDLPKLAVGSGRLGGPWKVEIGLRGYPIGSRGQVGISVQLATEFWDWMRPEQHETVSFEVRTTYSRAAEFGRDLRAVLDGRSQIARIEGDHFA